jgi:hypothetical protein
MTEREDLRKKHKPVLPQLPVVKSLPRVLAMPSHLAPGQQIPRPITPTLVPHRSATISEVAAANEENSSSDEGSSNDDACRSVKISLWSAHPPCPAQCPHCHEEGCCGCTCMCLDSEAWLPDHDHYFATCECGVDDCSGCKCVCSISTVLKEHGGHVQGKKKKVYLHLPEITS